MRNRKDTAMTINIVPVPFSRQLTTRSYVTHVRYFYGKRGHEFAILKDNKVEHLENNGQPGSQEWHRNLGKLANCQALFTKAPKTGWSAMFESATGERVIYVGLQSKSNKITKALVSELKTAMAADQEEVQKRLDPAYMLEVRLKRHDWSYEYSDDYRYWSSGFNNLTEIKKLMEIVPKHTANRLYKKYCPR
jgi:hypothetical protein